MNRRDIVSLIVLLGIPAPGGAADSTHHLTVTADALSRLRALRSETKFLKNSIMTSAEKAAMTPLIDQMLDRVLRGVEANPTRSWLVRQIRPSVEKFFLEDTEVREPCINYVAAVYEALGLQHSGEDYRDFMIEF